MRIYIDVETIPCQTKSIEQFIERVHVPANYKKPETIQKYKEDNAREHWLKTALSPNWGQIVCIAWKIPEMTHETHATWLDDGVFEHETEQALLADFFAHVGDAMSGHAPEWVGHNVGFDLNFLARRALIHRIRSTVHIPYTATAWSGRYTDTMFLWGGAQEKVSLKELCEILQVPIDDDDISGADVWDYVLEGDIVKVVEHCKKDVDRVYAVHGILEQIW